MPDHHDPLGLRRQLSQGPTTKQIAHTAYKQGQAAMGLIRGIAEQLTSINAQLEVAFEVLGELHPDGADEVTRRRTEAVKADLKALQDAMANKRVAELVVPGPPA